MFLNDALRELQKNVWVRSQNRAKKNFFPLRLETYLAWTFLFLCSFLNNYPWTLEKSSFFNNLWVYQSCWFHPGLLHPRCSWNSNYSLSQSSCLLSSCYMSTVLSAVTLVDLSSLLFFWFKPPPILHSVSPGVVPTRHCAPPPPPPRSSWLNSLLPPRCHSLELSSYLCPHFS